MARYTSPERLSRETRAPLPICRLIFAVAADDEENIGLIRGGDLHPDTVRQRWAVILVSRLHIGAGLEEIARALNLSHSTVKRAIDAMMLKWLEDEEFRRIAGRLTMEKEAWTRPAGAPLLGVCMGVRKRQYAA